jgi:hypothetical protein
VIPAALHAIGVLIATAATDAVYVMFASAAVGSWLGVFVSMTFLHRSRP